jgi:holo-[acyl-carrier protein] synthase
MDIAHGIDLVDFGRIDQMLARHKQRFLNRVFTAKEQAQAFELVDKNQSQRLAGRFASKEAILKLLGTGWRGKIAWTDMEITNNALGQPQVALSGEVERIAKDAGVGNITLSITHTANFAIASAVALRSGESEKIN